MKNIMIPKGKTCHYESVQTGNLVVLGTLIVDETITARHIIGKGILSAGAISARTVSAMDVECAHMTAEKLTAERVSAVELHISGAVAVSCNLAAQYVEAGKLTVALSQIGELCCDDVINLTRKRRSLLGTLFASSIRSLWASIFYKNPGKNEVMDANWQPQGDPRSADAGVQAATADKPQSQSAQEDAPQAVQGVTPFPRFGGEIDDEFEIKRLAALYQVSKGHGYYLKLIPITVEQPATTAQNTERTAA